MTITDDGHSEEEPELDRTRVDGPDHAPDTEEDHDAGVAKTVLKKIEASVRDALFGQPAPPLPRIGRFVLLDRLGQGGMGAVHAAYDEELDRKVAIKVLLNDYEDDEEQRLRLQREAQAMARLSHPNVAVVHEVGHDHGALFIAMEFIRGQSLESWLRGEPAWPEVLEAFAQAGRGLLAAHEAGIVHRDFKPQNAMRTDDGVVKVLDFGLARATGHAPETLRAASGPASGQSLTSTLTMAGSVMGTPAYMAPEQHRGEETDARTDQYSFCIAVWRGLAGRRPFEASTLIGLLETKLEGPTTWPDDAPAVPRSVIHALRRGLSPEPADRWPSMASLLDALRWDPGRRRRRWMLGAAALGVAALSGTAIQGWSEARAQRCAGAREKLEGVWDESRRAEAKAAITSIDRPYVARVWTRTEGTLDEYADAWVEMHEEACEATSVRGEQSAAMLDRRMRCLNRASLQLEATVNTLASADSDVVAKAHVLLAKLPPLARCSNTDALEAQVEPPLPREAEVVGRARRRLARAVSESSAGRPDAAREQIEAAEALLTDVEYGPIHAELGARRAIVSIALGDYEAAEASLLESLALALKERLLLELPGTLRQLIFVVGFHQQRMDDALRYWPLLESISTDDLDVAASLAAHGKILLRQGRYEEAEAEFRESLRSTERLLDADHATVTSARETLGLALLQQGKYDEAEAELRAVIRARENALGPDHPRVAESRNNLGGALERQARLDEAELEYGEAARVFLDALGPDHPQVTQVRSNHANIAMKQGRNEDAEAEYRQVLRVQLKARGADDPGLGNLRNNLGLVLENLGRYEEAEQELRESLRLKTKTYGEDHPAVAITLGNLGNILAEQGKLEDAERMHREALRIKEKGLGSEHPSTAIARNNLGSALESLGRDAEAEAEHRAGLEIWEKVVPGDHPNLAQARQVLAALLLRAGRLDEALSLAEQSWARRRQPGIQAKDRAETAFTLARILWMVEGRQRDRTRARELAEDAARSYEAKGAAPEALAEVQGWLEEHPLP